MRFPSRHRPRQHWRRNVRVLVACGKSVRTDRIVGCVGPAESSQPNLPCFASPKLFGNMSVTANELIFFIKYFIRDISYLGNTLSLVIYSSVIQLPPTTTSHQCLIAARRESQFRVRNSPAEAAAPPAAPPPCRLPVPCRRRERAPSLFRHRAREGPIHMSIQHAAMQLRPWMTHILFLITPK